MVQAGIPLRRHGRDHGHIYGQRNGLIEAGGDLVMVHDPDPLKVARPSSKAFPQARVRWPPGRRSSEDPRIKLVAAAAVPCGAAARSAAW